MIDGSKPKLSNWLQRNLELGTLLFLVVFILALWCFAELAERVFDGETLDLDTRLLLAFRATNDPTEPLGPQWLKEVGRDVTALGGVFFVTLTTLATAGFFWLSGRIGSMLFLVAAVVGGVLVSTLAKEIFSRPRPDLVPHGSIVHTASFPSGHSMMAAVVFLTLGMFIARSLPKRRLKIYVLAVAVLITILVGVSRVYLGVHWPTDVLAGWLAGGAWAILCLLGARLLARHGDVEPEAYEDEQL